MKTKLFALISLLLLLTSCSSGVTSDRFFTLDFYETEVIPSTTYIERGEIAAVEFYAAVEFSGIEVLAAKVAEDDTLTVTVYKFDTDYKTTLQKGKKVETGRKNLCKLKRVAKIFTPVEKRCGKTCGDCGKV